MAKKTNKLRDYLIQLSKAQELLQAFYANPERAMVDAGLEESDRDLVLRSDVSGIRARVQEDDEDVILVPPVHVPPVHTPCPPSK